MRFSSKKNIMIIFIPYVHALSIRQYNFLIKQEETHVLGTFLEGSKFSPLSNQGWIGYAGTHVPVLVHKLGLIKPRQT